MIFTNLCLIFCRSVAFCRTIFLPFVGRIGRALWTGDFFLLYLFDFFSMIFTNFCLIYFVDRLLFVGRFCFFFCLICLFFFLIFLVVYFVGRFAFCRTQAVFLSIFFCLIC